MPSTKRSVCEQHIRGALTRRGFTQGTIKALMRARQMLIIATASMIIELSEGRNAKEVLQGEIRKRDLMINELQDALRLLQARMSRIEARHRSHYTAEERYKILLYKETYSLSLEETEPVSNQCPDDQALVGRGGERTHKEHCWLIGESTAAADEIHRCDS